jgi:hypothetical protein
MPFNEITISLFGATMEQAALGVLAIGAVAVAAMAVWEWFRARVIEQWNRDYR